MGLYDGLSTDISEQFFISVYVDETWEEIDQWNHSVVGVWTVIEKM